MSRDERGRELASHMMALVARDVGDLNIEADTLRAGVELNRYFDAQQERIDALTAERDRYREALDMVAHGRFETYTGHPLRAFKVMEAMRSIADRALADRETTDE